MSKRKTDDESVRIFTGTVWSEELTPDRPKNHLADVDSHRLATPERLEAARSYWPERDVGDFEAYGRTGRKVVDRTTGVMYSLVEHDVFQQEHPEDSPVEFFYVHAGWLWLLKRHGSGVPAAGTGVDAAAFGGEVKFDRRSGRPVLVDSLGRRIRTRLTSEGGRL